ncbi:solute carrier organic anion transporter family member 4A1-like isoform X3 [Strongylocentrotus purpuratus]|uniref:Solute carrier organic anion transporter family member n=1 Tax=Strongylocentrotus purpuratus TaxID=7668 RepID=A0A7M7STT1_STRPU|nr:solute carrier organic anion transporter family member 4A1-like isoform X3 [Strongylocentrotus purpuratus]
MSFYHDFSFIQMEGPTLNTSLASNISNGQTTSRPKEIVTSCGWCDWRPRWLQRFNSQRWLLAAISSAACMTLMIEDGFTNSAITSIERRFQLRSQDIGTILSIYEFTVIISIIPVTYFGGRGNKPRWISIGCFVVGVASLLFALPHFTTERYAYFSEKGNEQATCHLHEANSSSTSSVDSCRRNGKSISLLSRYIILFGAAKVIAGIGAPPQGSLGVVFIDESITTKQNGMYLSTYLTMGTFGSAIGYILAGIFLNIYTDIDMPPGMTASPSDPGWVGAWWLGFVIAGFVIIALSIPIGLFPRELPKTARIRAEKPVESHKNSGLGEGGQTPRQPQSEAPRLVQEIRGVLEILKHLAINPTYVLTVCSTVPDVLLINSFAAFLPKLLENQFMVTSSTATIITGIAVIPGSVFGTFLGGWVMRRRKLKVPGLIKLAILGSTIETIAFLCVLMHCPQTQIAGVTTAYDSGNGSTLLNLTSSCNIACSCSADKFKPVCLEESGLSFFSPCHAGCSQDFENGTYGGCSCSPGMSFGIPSTVRHGKCSTPCNLQPAFIFMMNVVLVAIFMSKVPLMNIVLRLHSRPHSLRCHH